MSTAPHSAPYSRFPLVGLAAAFALGVLLARQTPLPLAPCLAAAFAFTVAAALSAVTGRYVLAARFVLPAFALMGASLALLEARPGGVPRLRGLYEQGTLAAGGPAELTGVLERAPEVAPDGLVLSVRAEAVRQGRSERACAGRVELFAVVRDVRAAALYESLELRRGARVRVMAALGRAERFRDPGVTPFGEYLERREVDAAGFVKSPLLFERLDDERVFLPFAWLDAWRAGLVEAFDRTFSNDTAGVLKAALLGNRRGLSRRTAESFREGGTFHVLVISGLHITFLGGLAWAVARRLTRRRAAQWAAAVACVWGYAALVGAESSVVRAALMFTFAALAPVLGRRSQALNALGAAALLLLAWRPQGLFDPSFQLTFLSVLAIVACAVPLLSKLKEVGEWRPTRATPYPPACPGWFRAFGEALFWSECRHLRESALATHSYRLFKTRAAARLERWRLQGPLRFVFCAFVVSAAVQVFLLPLLVLYFHRLTPASLPLNVFVGALMAGQAFAALAALCVSQLSTGAAAPLVWLTEQATRLMVGSVAPFKAAGVASFRLPEYAGGAGLVYVLYFAPLLTLTRELLRWRPVREAPSSEDTGAGRRRRTRLALCAVSLLAAVIVAHPLSAGLPDGRLRIDFLDVGQGDAALVTAPDGTTLLVDGGGRPNYAARREAEEDGEPFERDARGVGEAVVSEYLWWRGLGRVDYLLATHADADHLGGLSDVLKNFASRAAFVSGATADGEEYARFDAAARGAGVPVYQLERGDRLRLGRAFLEVLWPPPSARGTTSPNNGSLVLRLSLGRRCFLLAGDIESAAERALVAAADPLRCDAVKVAHHGSRSSSTEDFVRASAPALAVVSAGLDSPYGHPHPEVLRRWRAGGAQVLTTGERGMITLTTDGEDLKIETFVKE